jgi:hypothetical protein
VPARKSERELHIAWTTVTYRSVATAVLILVCAVGIGFWILAPDTARAGVAAAENWIGRVLDRIGSTSAGTTKTSGQQQANFTNIEGTVRVKKSNSNVWVNAAYDVPLEKGDVVQTGSEGMAKVAFIDGTNYTVKPDSLIVIEENSTNAAQQTAVAVQVTTGTVDLATATFSRGSKSEVTVAGATASLAPDSAAMVHNDPRADQHEILVKRGSGDVTRGTEVVHLGSYEKVSFAADAPTMTKSKEIAPPTLITPANMAPLFTTGGTQDVTFNWTPVDNAKAYHVLVSRNAYFSSTVLDRKVPQAQFNAPLTDGAYYWLVRSVDDKGKESVDSEKNRFTLIPKGADNASLALEINPFVQHGHVIEISGKTAPSARVMVNGEEVPVIGNDGSFHYFTPPLPNGENVITVTAQDNRGAVNTQQRKIVIQ